MSPIFVPFVGAGLYALVKPCEDRAGLRERRLRTRFLESVLADRRERCGECAAPLEPEFRCCPVCGERVRSTCGGCDRPVRTAWATCPWCTKPLGEREAAALSEVA